SASFGKSPHLSRTLRPGSPSRPARFAAPPGECTAKRRGCLNFRGRIGDGSKVPAVVARSPRCCGTVSTLLWHGLLTVPHAPTAGLPSSTEAGDLRSGPWHGRETVPQRGTVGRPCHNAVPPSLPQVPPHERPDPR